MNELWVVGVLGGGAGAAIGAPLLFRRAERTEWTTERLAGLWLVGAAFAMLLVGMRHGGLFPAPLDLYVEHFTNAMGLVAWSLLVMLTRRIGGVSSRRLNSIGHHLMMPAVYFAIIVAAGIPDIRFFWLLPVNVVALVLIGLAWREVRTSANTNADVKRQVTAIFVFAIVYGASQAIRSAFPRVLALREIVPVTMTLSFFAIGFALSGRWFASSVARPVSQSLAQSRPRYAKSGLTDDKARSLIDRLDDAMTTDAWYRDPDMSLKQLADRLGVTSQSLSQALNQQREQSLIEYLTNWRMRDAKQRLSDRANDCFTIEGVARQSGFASRSAFYKAFKEAEGVTPTEWRGRTRLELSTRSF